MESKIKKETSKFYAAIKGGMLTYKLTATELIIYATIHGFSQGGRSFCNSSLSQFEEITGQSRSNVQKAIIQLEKLNLIVSISPKNKRLNKSYYSVISRTEEDFPETKNLAVKKTDEIQIKGWMREYNLNAKQLILLALIERHSYDGYSVYVSYMPEMMAWTGLQKDENVRNNLKALEEKKAIVRIENGEGKARSYYTTHSRDGVYLDNNENTPPKKTIATPPKSNIAPPEKNTVTPPESNTSNILTNKFIRTAANNKTYSNNKRKLEIKKEPAAALKNQFIKTFGFLPDFSFDLYEKLEQLIPDEKLRCLYIQSEYDREKGKAKDIVQYFYKTAKCENNIKSFLDSVKEKEESEKEQNNQKTICPVCGKSFHKALYDCPICNTSISDFNNIKKVEKKRLIWSWSEDKRKAYEEKYFSYKSELSPMERLRICNSDEYKRGEKEYQQNVDIEFGLNN